jgi:hypothetical protein
LIGLLIARDQGRAVAPAARPCTKRGTGRDSLGTPPSPLRHSRRARRRRRPSRWKPNSGSPAPWGRTWRALRERRPGPRSLLVEARPPCGLASRRAAARPSESARHRASLLPHREHSPAGATLIPRAASATWWRQGPRPIPRRSARSPWRSPQGRSNQEGARPSCRTREGATRSRRRREAREARVPSRRSLREGGKDGR